jgi:hypothetical protein
VSDDVEVTALAINVTVPEELRWTDVRRGEEFRLSSLNVRLLPDGRLAAKAYGRPTAGGRGTYVSFGAGPARAGRAGVRGRGTRRRALDGAPRPRLTGIAVVR